MTRPEEPQESAAPPHMETATASPARSDKSSDSEGRPVREKLQETRIDAARQPPRSASGSDSDRGRLRRKRSREALDDDHDHDADADDADQPDRKHEKLDQQQQQPPKPARHTRKRSRDMTTDVDSGALAKLAAAKVPTIEEADSDAPKDSAYKNKRTRDQVEATAQQPAAHDAPASGTATPRADDERETKRPRDKDEAHPAAEPKSTSASSTKIPAGSGFANTSAASPFAAMAAKPAPVTKTDALPQTSQDKFKASGFGSLAASTTSPFGGLAASSGSPFAATTKLTSFAGPIGAKASPPASTSPTAPSSGFGSLSGSTTSAFGGSSFGGSLGGGFGGFGTAKAGVSSFATPGAPGITGLSSKPERAFGAPGDKTDGKDSDDDDDEDNEDDDKDADDDRRSSQPALPSQPTETGEEGEETLWTGRAKLYAMVGEGKERGWKERGTGAIKLNVTLEEPKKARFVLRADGTHRLLLNTAVTKKMTLGGDSQGDKPKDGRLLFNSPTADGELEMHLLKLKAERAVELWELVGKVQEEDL